jgi:hypothetical protein
MDPTQILSRLQGDNPPTDAELEKAAADIREALDEVTKPGAPRDKESIALAKTLREALDTLAAEDGKRQEAAAALEAELADLRKGVFDEDKPEATEDEKADEKPADEAKADDKAPEATEVKEPVAASVSDLVKRLQSQVSARTKTAATDEVRSVPGVHLRGLGTAASFDLKDGTLSDLGSLFSTHAKSVTQRNSPTKLFSLTKDYDPTRQLGNNTDENNRRLTEVFGFGETTRPVTAAGGLCGPGDVDHSHPICADRGRPVRDSLVQFNASRGQVTYHPSAGLGAVEGGVSIWTPAMDAAAVPPNPSGLSKPCPPVDCPDELNAEVDAVVRCLTIGNFQARFSPEFWASRLELLLAAHDRAAEQKSIVEIHEASVGVTAIPATKNVIESFLQNVNSIIAADRGIQRKLQGQYVVLADAWVRDQIRNQVIENLGVANNVETIQIADATIAGWLSDIGARAVWTYDGTLSEATGEHNIPAAVGALPGTTTVYVYPEDAYFFLDGGTLDLGTEITDSALNAVNNRQAFAETFEKTAFRGCSSYRFELSTTLFCGCA